MTYVKIKRDISNKRNFETWLTPEETGITMLTKTGVTNKLVMGSRRITHCLQMRTEKIGQHATENGNNLLFKFF